MTPWTVHGKRTAADAWHPVGEVHAPDVELALLLARESFFRHGEGVALAVERDGAWAEGDVAEPATDKSYKRQSGYAGLGRRRRAAVETTARAGRTIRRSRPPVASDD